MKFLKTRKTAAAEEPLASPPDASCIDAKKPLEEAAPATTTSTMGLSFKAAKSKLSQGFSMVGSTISIVNDTDHTYFIRVGSDQQALRTAKGALKITAGAVSILTLTSGKGYGARRVAGTAVGSACVADGLNDVLRKDDYIEVPPGTTWVSGTMTLALWQQCEALCQRRDRWGRLRAYRMTMRPLFSASTPGRTNAYSLKEWENKEGQSKEITNWLT